MQVVQFMHKIAGELKNKGRRNVQNDYMNGLLDYKIVVVAQRDTWEGHYRLFESMSGGELVLTDPMLPLPDGIEDRKHLVVYHSIRELKDLIIYYLNNEEERLRIAREGLKEVPLHHRTWHDMENFFLGND